MVLKIIFLSLFFILTALLLCFLFYILIPGIKKQTKIEEDLLFNEIEKDFVVPKEDGVLISENRAIVLCCPNKSFQNPKQRYTRKLSCALIASQFNSLNDCKFSCIGHGDCIKSCPQEAIYIENSTAVISNLCIGCGNCLNSCPKGIIRLIPKNQENIILCNNKDGILTSCSSLNQEQKVQRKQKKGFKIWELCYKLIKN